MKDYDGKTTFRKVQSSEVIIRLKCCQIMSWETMPSHLNYYQMVGKHCHHTSEQAIVFFLEILEKTVIDMFIKVFADGKLMMAWLYILTNVKLFLCIHMTDFDYEHYCSSHLLCLYYIILL